MTRVDTLLIHAHVVTSPPTPRAVYGRRMKDLVDEPDAGIAIHEGRILDVDASRTLLKRFRPNHTFNVRGRLITPGLVDPHTHLVFAGDRAQEFEMKMRGASYLDIARAGGGIVSTVKATRAASSSVLVKTAWERLNRLMAHGVTTVEIKSGYGLSWPGEIKMLNVIRYLQRRHPLEIVPTFLGAHVVPPEFRNRRSAYLSLVNRKLIPYVAAHELAEFCDVFCDVGAFTVKETQTIFEAAGQAGLTLKLHAQEFSRDGGVQLACRFKAVSTEHLLLVSSEDIRAMSEAGVVPVLLPGTPFGLGLKTYAPARRMIEAGLPVALGSDCNPGTTYSESMPLIMTLACTQMKMTPAEALTAATINAAAAINRAHRLGTIEPHKQADLVLWDTNDYRHLTYHYGVNLVLKVMKRGKWIFSRQSAIRNSQFAI